MLRYVRYAASVFFALLAIALVGLWLRSRSYGEELRGPIGKKMHLHVGWSCGIASFQIADREFVGVSSSSLRFTSAELDAPTKAIFQRIIVDKTPLKLGFEFHANRVEGLVFAAPIWFLAACSFALAALFAFKRAWRFSVRGLLIATTLLAALLGLAVWVA